MSYGGAAAGLMAAVLALRRRQLIDTFDRFGATSPETARSREELGIGESRMFRRLVRRGVLRAADDGMAGTPIHYYLDLVGRARDRSRRQILLAVVGLLAVLGLVFVLTGNR